jgi:transcription antitermination factor NusG
MESEMEKQSPDFRWYALCTRSRQEKKAASMLEALGIPHFLPLKCELRQWSDRKQPVRVPLFQGYLFVRSNLTRELSLEILKTPGVARFVGNSTGPLPIPDEQIGHIRQALDIGLECEVQPVPEAGTRVRVVRGPLCGIEGTLVRTNSTMRMFIAIETIHKTLAVNVSAGDIEPASTDSR